MPKVRLALLSDDINSNEDDNTYCMIGIFKKKHAIGFPVKEKFAVSVFWDVLGTETFDYSLTINDSDANILQTAYPLRIVLADPQTITFTRFMNVLFYVPGLYTVNILVNGKRVDQVSFVIEQLNLHDMAL
jgi:Family of unknown function (DUF6941)